MNNLIRKSKKEYYSKKFESVKNKLRKTWKTINCIIGRNKRSNPQTKFTNSQGSTISDPQMISDEFNDFFVNIGPQLASTIKTDGKQYYDCLKTPMTSCMFLKPIEEEEIIKIIYKFNQNKSAGHDDIGNFIVKRIAK